MSGERRKALLGDNWEETLSDSAARAARDKKATKPNLADPQILLGAEVTLEIHAELPDAASDKLVRDITENCRTLRFDTHGFENT